MEALSREKILKNHHSSKSKCLENTKQQPIIKMFENYIFAIYRLLI